MTRDNLKLPGSEKRERLRKKSQGYNQVNGTKDQVQGGKYQWVTSSCPGELESEFVFKVVHMEYEREFSFTKGWNMLRGGMAI